MRRTARQRLAALAAGLFVLVAPVGLGACGGASSARQTAGPGGLPRPAPSAAGAVARTIRVGAEPYGIASASGTIWVANLGGDSVSRVDPGTGRVTNIHVQGGPISVAIDRKAVWVADYRGQTVSRIDAVTNRVVANIRIGPNPVGVAIADGLVWGVAQRQGTVSVIAPATDQVVHRLRLPDGFTPGFPLAADGSVWVPDFSDSGDSVVRIDPATARIVGRVRVGSQPIQLTQGAGALWVANAGRGAPTVSRVDPATDTVTATVRLPGDELSGICFGGGMLWVPSIGAAALYRIDPSDQDLTRLVTAVPNPRGVTWADGQVWVAESAAGVIAGIQAGA